MTSHYRCTCGLIDAHAHCLPPAYRRALSDAGFTSLDGGYPIPSWSAEKAIEVMDANGIDTMMLSVSSPSVGFLPDEAARVKLAHRINEDVAQTVKAHPGRFGGFATLPLPHVEASLREIEHAFGELKLDGVVIETNTNGKYLGNPALAPIFDGSMRVTRQSFCIRPRRDASRQLDWDVRRRCWNFRVTRRARSSISFFRTRCNVALT